MEAINVRVVKHDAASTFERMIRELEAQMPTMRLEDVALVVGVAVVLRERSEGLVV